MYAVIATGGKQYRVSEGDTLKVEKLPGEEGSKVELDQVLMVAHGRGKKVEIIKFRRRKHHRKQMGHRQDFTEIEINKIKA